jgi:hypothetical protein
VGSLTATGTASLQSLTFTNATGSNLSFATASGTNLSVQNFNFVNATATGQWRVLGNVGIGPNPVVVGNNVLQLNTSNQSVSPGPGFSAFEIDSDSGTKSDFFFRLSSSTAAGYPSVTLGRSDGSLAAPTVVTNGMVLGGFTFNGYDGGVWRYAAEIRATVDGVPGSGDMPTALRFFTTPDGSATDVERMTINNAGNVGINVTNPTNFRLTVGGSVGPSANNAFDFGSATNSWRDVYVSGTAMFGGVVSTTELFVGGKRACLEDGTNCSGGVKTASSSSSVNLNTTEVELLSINSASRQANNMVWAVANVRVVRTGGAGTQTANFRIVRGASCAAGVRVGLTIPVATVTSNLSEMITLSFVDAPSSTAALQYNLCAVRIGAAGTISVTHYDLTIQNVFQGADLGEVYYAIGDQPAPGELVSLDPSGEGLVRRTTSSSKDGVLGVISTRPGLVLSETSPYGGAPVVVALSGRVPVKVTAERGEIRPGDALSVASVDGHAARALETGPMVGRALSGFVPSAGSTSTETGTVVMFVQAGYYFPVDKDEAVNRSATDTQALQDAATAEEIHPAASTDFIESLEVSSLSVKDVVATGQVVMEGELRLHGPVIFSSVNAGSVTVAPGETKVHVAFASPYPYTPRVVVTPEVEDVSNGRDFANDVWDGGYYLSRVTVDGFDIRLPRGYCATIGDCPIRLHFNWFVTAMEGGTVTSTPAVSEEIPAPEEPTPNPVSELGPQSEPEAAPSEGESNASSTSTAPESTEESASEADEMVPEPAPGPEPESVPAEAVAPDPDPEPTSDPEPAPAPEPTPEPTPAE